MENESSSKNQKDDGEVAKPDSAAKRISNQFNKTAQKLVKGTSDAAGKVRAKVVTRDGKKRVSRDSSNGMLLEQVVAEDADENDDDGTVDLVGVLERPDRKYHKVVTDTEEEEEEERSSTTLNLAGLVERPPTERKYHKVNPEDRSDPFLERVSHTVEVLERPFVTAAHVVEEIVDDLRGCAATNESNVEKTKEQNANDQTDFDLSGALERPADHKKYKKVDPKSDDDEYAVDFAGALKRPPSHKKYRKVDGDDDDNSSRFSKVMSETAEVLAKPFVAGADLANEGIHKMSDATSNCSAHDDAVITGEEDMLLNTTDPKPPRSSSMKSPILGLKKVVSKGTRLVTENIEKAKNKVTDTSATESHPAEGGAEDSEQLSLLRDDSGGKKQRSVHFKEAPPSRRSAAPIGSPLTGVKKLVSNATHLVTDNIEKAKNLVSDCEATPRPPKLDRYVSEKTTDAVAVPGNDDDGPMEDISSVRTVLSQTVKWRKKTFRKTRNVLHKVVGRKKRKHHSIQDKGLRVSESSQITVDGELEDEDGIIEIVVTPLLEFLLHDICVASLILFVVASIPTYRNWSSIMNNQLPASVIWVWLLVSFCAGMEIGRFRGMRSVEKLLERERSGEASTIAVTAWESEGDISERSVPSVIDVEEKQTSLPPVKPGYALVYQLFRPIGRFRLVYPSDLRNLTKDGSAAALTGAVRDASGKFWSTLTHTTRETWEQVGFVKVADPLMNRLLKNPDYQRKPLKEMVSTGEEEDATGSKRIGTFDIAKCEAVTLEDEVIDPSCTLRGMDVFLNDAPETSMATHPFLIREGVRDTPTLIANIMVQWANILIYFELPEWFTDFDSIEEKDDDANDVRAIKRFLSGDDEYRNSRFKVFPCLVDGPLPIRMIAPPKKEITIPGEMLPSKWVFHKAETAPNGQPLKPCLEVELDIVSNGTLRSISSMLRRYIKGISLDLAIIVDKPTPESPDEPSACLGLWRFHHIDVDSCPPMPQRQMGETELQKNIRRASQFAGISPSQQLELLKELDESDLGDDCDNDE